MKTRYVLVDRSTDAPRYFVRTQRQGPFWIALSSLTPADAKRFTKAAAHLLQRTSQRRFTVEQESI